MKEDNLEIKAIEALREFSRMSRLSSQLRSGVGGICRRSLGLAGTASSA